MENLCVQNPSNVIFSCFNITYVCNTFFELTNLVSELAEVLIVAKTKLNTSFPTAQFSMLDFLKPFRLDVTANSGGGLLIYVKRYLPDRELKAYKLLFDIQAIRFEINLTKEKWFSICIYKPPSQKSQDFLNFLADLLHFFQYSMIIK